MISRQVRLVQILRTFTTLRVTINREMPEQVHTIFYLYAQQNYSTAVFP